MGGAEYGDGGAEGYTRGPTWDRGQHDVGSGHGEVIGVMLADAEEVETDLLRQYALLDDVANRPGMRDRATVLVVEISERVQAERQRKTRPAAHAAITPNASSNSAPLRGRPEAGPSG